LHQIGRPPRAQLASLCHFTRLFLVPEAVPSLTCHQEARHLWIGPSTHASPVPLPPLPRPPPPSSPERHSITGAVAPDQGLTCSDRPPLGVLWHNSGVTDPGTSQVVGEDEECALPWSAQSAGRLPLRACAKQLKRGAGGIETIVRVQGVACLHDVFW
jgi:hypothetical protein